ncbi:MAG: hypothetical protein ACYCU8_00170 [Ferrimicrobium acidiphilum]
MKVSSQTKDIYDEELAKRVHSTAMKVATHTGRTRDIQEIEQEIWASLLSLGPNLSEQEREAATSSTALFRRGIDYTRTLDPLSRKWRQKLIYAVQEDDGAKSVHETMEDIGVPLNMRQVIGAFPVGADDFIPGEKSQEERIVLRQAVQDAIIEFTKGKLDELDRAILHDYLLNEATTLGELAHSYAITESAVSLRAKRMRSRLQTILARHGVTAEDLH